MYCTDHDAVGDEVPFPGLNLESYKMVDTMRGVLERKFSGLPAYRGYQPMFGWNPATGEPWLAIRAYTDTAYLRISGQGNECIGRLQALIFQRTGHGINIRYVCMSSRGYILLWSEYVSEDMVHNQTARRNLGEVVHVSSSGLVFPTIVAWSTRRI